ncbi:class I SAM-dependent methyltransferase [Halioglobus pacificus]|uniref:class I SAM-dependent methyltransferase n=1 Tax=Parahalioglobus pacificus TaxID=930806 RepID=UPI001674BCFC|nr:class I SAM-dependent methyltransferase [Halioglobus pacificus]
MTELDTNAYWRKRHDDFRENSQGVGNLSLSRTQNDAIYERARQQMAAILDSLGVASGGKALDLGCGIGMMAPPIIERGLEYVGVDVSPTAIEIASSSHPNGNFQCSDLTTLALRGTRFDIILERTVFIHLVSNQKFRAAVRVVSDHLSDSGVFLIHDKICVGEEERPAPHVVFRSQEQWDECLGLYGLEFNSALQRRLHERGASRSLSIVTKKR